ncbi:hypothetical protein [Bordetella avium]|nr:hypothetical protein [Bordetella avium]AZY52504.1 hypothetical protein C0J07_08290 [Bordetella avium]RIQ19332.1 hypothetical protein D0850_04580 [Bordetella avium]RIQ33500.1 hypothetical protein D0849_11270 [Bordetella avium]RIQ72853.1 hypothetical protein D0839_00385 [Bordetella avium]
MSKLGIWADYENKIVCNELRRQDLISHQDWVHDASYCAARFSAVTYQGYRAWALPCLALMRRSPRFARGVAAVVGWMVADIKYQKGLSKNSNLLGRAVSKAFFWPANWIIGNIIVSIKSINSYFFGIKEIIN